MGENHLKLNVNSTEWTLKQIMLKYSICKEFDMVTKMATVALIIPGNNTCPVCGASAMKRFKTRNRSSMENYNGPDCRSQGSAVNRFKARRCYK